MKNIKNYKDIDILPINSDINDKDIDLIVDKIIKVYHNEECEIQDILDSLSLNNLSISNVIKVYSMVYKIIEKDEVIRKYYEGGYIDLATNKQYLNNSYSIKVGDRFYSEYFSKYGTITKYNNDNDWYFILDGTKIEMKAKSNIHKVELIKRGDMTNE